MDMENPLLKYLAFVKTVEKSSFTAAAASMDYAQSSVSKMIADLEKEWGMTLLERSKTGVCLTSAGEQMLPFVRNALRGYDQLAEQVSRMNGLETGIVRIGTCASVAINILPDVFARLKADYPGIEYELLLGDYNEVERLLDEGRIDCGFIHLTTAPRFQNIEVVRDSYQVVLPVGHPLAAEETVDIEELNGLPFLLLEHGGKTEVSDILESAGVKPDIAFTTWEDFAIMAMVEKGLGVSILPELILRRIPFNLEIRPLKVPYYRTIILAFKDRKSLTPAARKFIEYLDLTDAARAQ